VYINEYKRLERFVDISGDESVDELVARIRLGKGTFGEVFRVEDTRSRRMSVRTIFATERR
jgi:hypothetical protein